MKANEIKSATTEELILWFVRNSDPASPTKSGENVGRRISQELKNRGIVSEQFADKWAEFYRTGCRWTL